MLHFSPPLPLARSITAGKLNQYGYYSAFLMNSGIEALPQPDIAFETLLEEAAGAPTGSPIVGVNPSDLMDLSIPLFLPFFSFNVVTLHLEVMNCSK